MTQTVAIMQPYLFPYIGYFQLISAVDTFVLFDDVQYVDRSYMNRNKILNSGDSWLTLPVEKASRNLPINQRHYRNADTDISDLLQKLKICYEASPYFESAYDMIANAISTQSRNVADFNGGTIRAIWDYIDAPKQFLRSSNLEIDESLRGQDRIIAICELLGASRYVNASGGRALYDRADFASQGMGLSFIEPVFPRYPQFGEEFIPGLSIIDVLMFNSRQKVREMIEDFRLAP